MRIFRRKPKDALVSMRRLSPDYWIEIANRAYADGVIDESVIERIIAQSHRGLIPAIEYNQQKDWDIHDISPALYDYYNEFIRWELK